MPTPVWILIWVTVMALLAFFVVRERRSGRRGPQDVDRLRHTATSEAEMNREGRGPNGPSSTWIG
jgi:hypothetical protein